MKSWLFFKFWKTTSVGEKVRGENPPGFFRNFFLSESAAGQVCKNKRKENGIACGEQFNQLCSCEIAFKLIRVSRLQSQVNVLGCQEPSI